MILLSSKTRTFTLSNKTNLVSFSCTGPNTRTRSFSLSLSVQRPFLPVLFLSVDLRVETELLGETGKEPPTFVFGGNPIKEENVEIMSKRYRVPLGLPPAPFFLI